MGHDWLSPEIISGWQEIQGALSSMTGLELGIYDSEGPLGRASGTSPICADIRAHSARCEEECAGFIRETLAAPKGGTRYFRCRFGHKLFAVRLVFPGRGWLVLAGGKTFETRLDFAVAAEALAAAGVRVQKTGRHRYRFIGKRRLDELIGLVAGSATQYLNLSLNLSTYRLRLNRQAALVENASLLYQVRDVRDLVTGFLRAIGGLFGLDSLGIHLYALEEGGRQLHILHGPHAGRPLEGGNQLLDWLGRNLGPGPEPLRVDDDALLARLGFSSAAAIPAAVSGELLGFVCVYDAEVPPGDIDALRSCVQQMAVAIDNRRLRTGFVDKLERLKAASAIYSAAGDACDPDRIYELLLDRSAELMRAERASLMLYDDGTDMLTIKGSKGLHEDVLSQTPRAAGGGIAGIVAKTGAPIVVRNASEEKRPGISGRPDYKTGSFVSVPLKIGGRVVGVVNLADKSDGEPFDLADLEFLLGLASHAGTAIEGVSPGARRGGRVAGGRGSESFQAWLASELARSRRYGHALSLLVLDIDGFGEYEAENGEKAAAAVTERLQALLRSSLRAMDMVTGQAGGRVVAVLPETPEESALALCARIRRRVGAARFPDADGQDSRRITVSMGVAGYPAAAADPAGLYKAALAALGRASRGGGNAVCSYSQKAR